MQIYSLKFIVLAAFSFVFLLDNSDEFFPSIVINNCTKTNQNGVLVFRNSFDKL
jgi:hypothetical protein